MAPELWGAAQKSPPSAPPAVLQGTRQPARWTRDLGTYCTLLQILTAMEFFINIFINGTVAHTDYRD